MKKVLPFLFFLPLLATAQVGNEFYNKGADITVQSNALIYVQGRVTNITNGTSGGTIDNFGKIQAEENLENSGAVVNNKLNGRLVVAGDFKNGLTSPTTSEIKNDGVIEVSGNFQNAASSKFGYDVNTASQERAVIFTGNATQTISGSMNDPSNAQFYNLVLNGANGAEAIVELNNDITVAGGVVFGAAGSNTAYNISNPATLTVAPNDMLPGKIKTFAGSTEYLLRITNDAPTAIANAGTWSNTTENSGQQSSYIVTRGARASTSIGGLERKVKNTAANYLFPIGTQTNGYNGRVKLSSYVLL